MNTRTFTLAIALAAIACGHPPSTQSIPLLEPTGGLPPGFAWQRQEGPDFDVYLASSLTERATQIGVYLGTAPQFHPSATASGRPGTIAGHSVVWEQTSSEDFFRAETVFPYRHTSSSRELKVHVWVIAPTPSRLEALEASAGAISFRPRRTGDA